MLRTCLIRGPARLLLLFVLLTTNAWSAVLPMTDRAQFATRKVNFGGAAGCLTSGTYDVQTQVWTQTGPCGAQGMRGADGSAVRVESFEARLVGRVDNDGNALGGVFTVFGAIPAVGITEPSLLVRGSLIEASYGPAALVPGIFGLGANALIDMDFAVPVFGAPGDILLWESNATIAGWHWPLALSPENIPWRTSIGEADYHNYTNTQYMVYARSVLFAPEPGTLVLLGLGLVGVAAGRRRPR